MTDAAQERSIYPKLQVLKDGLGADGLAQARKLAEEKPTPERYAIWIQVSEGKPLASIV